MVTAPRHAAPMAYDPLGHGCTRPPGLPPAPPRARSATGGGFSSGKGSQDPLRLGSAFSWHPARSHATSRHGGHQSRPKTDRKVARRGLRSSAAYISPLGRVPTWYASSHIPHFLEPCACTKKNGPDNSYDSHGISNSHPTQSYSCMHPPPPGRGTTPVACSLWMHTRKNRVRRLGHPWA